MSGYTSSQSSTDKGKQSRSDKGRDPIKDAIAADIRVKNAYTVHTWTLTLKDSGSGARQI